MPNFAAPLGEAEVVDLEVIRDQPDVVLVHHPMNL
jgi:hypothetical protein